MVLGDLQVGTKREDDEGGLPAWTRLRELVDVKEMVAEGSRSCCSRGLLHRVYRIQVHYALSFSTSDDREVVAAGSTAQGLCP